MGIRVDCCPLVGIRVVNVANLRLERDQEKIGKATCGNRGSFVENNCFPHSLLLTLNSKNKEEEEERASDLVCAR